MSPSQLSQWVNASPNSATGRPRSVSDDSARLIEEKLNLPRGWMDADHEALKELRQTHEHQANGDEDGAEGLPVHSPRPVPVLGNTQAGPSDRAWADYGFPIADTVLKISVVDKDAYALRVVGDSMAPKALEGDFVVLAPSVTPRAGQDVVVCTAEGEVIVKTLAAMTPHGVTLSSVNQEFSRRVIERSAIQWIHVVAAYVPMYMASQVIATKSYVGWDRRHRDVPVAEDRRSPPGPFLSDPA